ncbi:serine acetyltransferase [Mumia sp. zg.B21]|uniref:serine O-acetyltransferase n=1 Tax=Mumia sp. zg.B21 TaxID=2855447 RepID=UPI001C6E87C9|nr:serine acetyltransferase [Mumia sp. zg.B21]MBW9210759.1 serine acetyltransferase [Mumia sp. zg.B21]
MRLLDVIREDLDANKGQPKGQLVVVAFRLAHAARSPVDRPVRWWAVPVGIVYRLLVEWVLGIEIPWKTTVGRRLRVLHGVGIVVNDGTVLGDDVVLRQNVTLGNKRGGLPCPVVEDDVRFGAGAIVIGDLTVGTGARVGAGAVVTRSVPPGATAVGNPAVMRLPDSPA